MQSVFCVLGYYSQVYFCYFLCIVLLCVYSLVARLLTRNQYPEGPVTGHLGTGFPWFSCVWKRMLRWFPSLKVPTACFSCSPSDLSSSDPYFIFMYMHYNHCHRATTYLQLNILLLLLLLLLCLGSKTLWSSHLLVLSYCTQIC